MMSQIQRAISINMVKTDPREVLFAEFLRGTGGIKSHLLNAGYAHWYSVALAENGESISTDVELALIKSLTDLSAQMTYLVEYHRIKHNIHLPADTLARCGVVNQASSPNISSKSAPIPAQSVSTKSEELPVFISANELEVLTDDDDDFFTVGAENDIN